MLAQPKSALKEYSTFWLFKAYILFPLHGIPEGGKKKCLGMKTIFFESTYPEVKIKTSKITFFF